VGAGSFGAVYKAEWFNAAVVVKVRMRMRNGPDS
jgi:predicted Ser/Thr protein kinase